MSIHFAASAPVIDSDIERRLIDAMEAHDFEEVDRLLDALRAQHPETHLS